MNEHAAKHDVHELNNMYLTLTVPTGLNHKPHTHLVITKVNLDSHNDFPNENGRFIFKTID